MTTSRLRVFAFVASALMVGTLAQAQSPSPGSKSAPAAAQSSAAASRSHATKATQVPANPSAQLVRDAANAGFRPTHVRGVLMFCRTAKELGSNFPVRTCYNEQQTKIKIQQYAAQRGQLRTGRFLPAGLPAGCNQRTCQ